MRAYRRVIKRRRYRCSCQCAAAPRLITAPAPPRLIPKGILGISVWVTVLIDKYLLYRPTYRLLADLRAHGLDLAQGTVTDGMRRLAPLFLKCRIRHFKNYPEENEMAKVSGSFFRQKQIASQTSA